MGIGPGFGLPDGPMPAYDKLAQDTFVAFGDLDASPTKAWIATHRNDVGMKAFVDFAFGRRPAEELYDLRKDPDQMLNVAWEAAYASVRERLGNQLTKILTETGDPRVVGDGMTFEKAPFAGTPKPGGRARRSKR